MDLSGAADLAVIGAILTAIITAVTLAVKAGPAWNQSLIKTARDEAQTQSKALEEERVLRRKAEDRAERYRYQLIRAGLDPYDQQASHE